MKPEIDFQPIVQLEAPTAYYSSNDIISHLYTKLDIYIFECNSYIHNLPHPKGKKIGRQRQPHLRVW